MNAPGISRSTREVGIALGISYRTTATLRHWNDGLRHQRGRQFVLGLVLVGIWLMITGGLVLGVQLMTVDSSEWKGWSLGLALMFILPYLVFSVATAGAVWLVFRLRRLN